MDDLSPLASLPNVSLDGCYIPAQQVDPESTYDGPCMSNGILNPSPLPDTDNVESEVEHGKSRPRASTGPSKSSKRTESSHTSARHSWSFGMQSHNTQCTYNITQHIHMSPTSSPATSGSGGEEGMLVQPLAESPLNQPYPNKEGTSGSRQDPGLTQPISTPSKICKKQGKLATCASDERDGESTSKTRIRPRSWVLSHRDKPKVIRSGKHSKLFFPRHLCYAFVLLFKSSVYT